MSGAARGSISSGLKGVCVGAGLQGPVIHLYGVGTDHSNLVIFPSGGGPPEKECGFWGHPPIVKVSKWPLLGVNWSETPCRTRE